MSAPETKRKALITGGAGFIGSHLAEVLLADGWEVFALDDLSTGSIQNVAHLKDRRDFHLVVDSVLSPAVLSPQKAIAQEKETRRWLAGLD